MQKAIDAVAEPRGVKVERVQMKNVEIPPSMQRATAQEAEALREKCARLTKAEVELDAAEQNGRARGAASRPRPPRQRQALQGYQARLASRVRCSRGRREQLSVHLNHIIGCRQILKADAPVSPEALHA